MIRLRLAQISGQLILTLDVNFIEEVLEKYIFSRNCGVGFQHENPMPIRLLAI